MAATRAQVDTLTARATRLLLQRFGRRFSFILRPFIRAAVREAKDVGTQQARNTLKATLREWYILIYSESPDNRREFYKWVQHALLDPDNSDPITGLDGGDAFNVDDTDGVS